MTDIVQYMLKSWDKMPQGSSREQKMEMVFLDLMAEMRRWGVKDGRELIGSLETLTRLYEEDVYE